MSTSGAALSNSTLTVVVFDEVTGAVIANATVVVDATTGGTGLTSLTDVNGEATFAALTGPVTITAGIAGFALTSLVGVAVDTVSLTLEPLASNVVVSGTLPIPTGAPATDPTGTVILVAPYDFNVAVSASQEARFTHLRKVFAPFKLRTTASNRATASLAFEMSVHAGVAFEVTRILQASEDLSLGLGGLGGFGPTDVLDSSAYEVQISSQPAATTDVNMGTLAAFTTTAAAVVGNANTTCLSEQQTPSTNGTWAPPIPTGSRGAEFTQTRVRGLYTGATTPALSGFWRYPYANLVALFGPSFPGADTLNGFFFVDPNASSVQIFSELVSSSGTGTSTVEARATDVQDLNVTTLPAGLVLPSIPTPTAPTAGATNVGLTPTISWNANSAFATNSGYTEVTLDQVDGTTVRGWRILLAPNLSSVVVPTLPPALATLEFQQFGSASQVRLTITTVQVSPTFDFDAANFTTASMGQRREGQVVLGYATAP
jgi:hypothetical protein